MRDNNKLIKICEDSLSNPYQYGVNDCNIVCLRVVDYYTGSNWSQIAKYKTFRTGIKQLKELGFESTSDIVKSVSEQVEFPIDGDIWIDPTNSNQMGVVMSGYMVGIDSEHVNIKLVELPEGDFYRIKRN